VETIKVTAIRNRTGGVHFTYELNVPRFIADLLAQDYEVELERCGQSFELRASADTEGASWTLVNTNRIDRWFSDYKVAVMHWNDCLAELREQIRNYPERICLKVSGYGSVHTVKGGSIGNLASILMERGKEYGQ
jgi:hypothetical protein